MHPLKITFTLATLSLACPLWAEESGGYGSVGFQYSNATQSTQKKAPSLVDQAPLFNVKNAQPTTLPAPKVPQNKVGQ
ncbi:hypothetical protein NHP190003_14750 [Helicobacter sp. NHP19-003]|uniref:Part of outer membrane protein HorA n=1 Tax=Helicobacter gastrocanis TaxID=2849641 RepID=A0ABN6I7X6_9HELI|nr:hypothetical protein [Helicobacter sp. NHP19-003]BCZ18193.1 hypothetical protein NHP190003_14750 [Helicobacter sp. NHP19-003]